MLLAQKRASSSFLVDFAGVLIPGTDSDDIIAGFQYNPRDSQVGSALCCTDAFSAILPLNAFDLLYG